MNPVDNEPPTLRDIGAIFVIAILIGLATAAFGSAVGSLLGYLWQ